MLPAHSQTRQEPLSSLHCTITIVKCPSSRMIHKSACILRGYGVLVLRRSEIVSSLQIRCPFDPNRFPIHSHSVQSSLLPFFALVVTTATFPEEISPRIKRQEMETALQTGMLWWGSFGSGADWDERVKCERLRDDQVMWWSISTFDEASCRDAVN